MNLNLNSSRLSLSFRYVIAFDHFLFQSVPFIHVILQVSLDSKLCVANMAKELAIMGIRRMNFFVVCLGTYRIGKCSITFETHSRTIVQVAQPKFKTYEIDLLDFIMVTDL